MAVTHNKTGPLTLCWISEKTDEPIQRKRPDGKMEGRTLIHRTLAATAGGPKIELWCKCKDLDDVKSCYCECSSACKIDEFLDIKHRSREEHVIAKFVLEPEDEILNTTETLLNNQKVTCQKSNCLKYTASIIICMLLLTVDSISCYCYNTRF